jgi:excisionase family DNA binding protein
MSPLERSRNDESSSDRGEAQNPRANRPFTTFEAAKRLGVAFSTVNYWIDSGVLPGFRTPGGHRRIWPADFDAFVTNFEYGRPGPKRKKILLVDDDNGFRRAMKRKLTSEKLRADLLEADNGFDAGRLIAEEKPTLVVLDIQLPGLDGFSVMQRINDMPYHPKVIAVSGHSPDEYRDRMLSLGASAFFAKPLDTGAFLAAVRGILEPRAGAVPTARAIPKGKAVPRAEVVPTERSDVHAR